MIRDVLTLAAVFAWVAVWTGLMVWIGDRANQRIK